MDQSITPLYNQLIKHQKKDSVSLHVPGHKNGQILGRPFSCFHSLLELDVTELTGLDDLHSPTGVINEAQELLTSLYGSQKSYFLVNGSTVGNLAMMLSVLNEDDIVFVQRNSHKSIHNGVELTGAKPVYLDPEFNEEWGISGGVSPSIVRQALQLYPNVKAIVLTYPNYYGLVNDLETIVTFAHSRNIPVLVDEAHGAHFITGGPFPKSALQLGADIVVQSAHKTLPAMTMGSFLHINSSYVSHEAVEKYLRILQSSSPSYPIMASLDIARCYAATYRDEDHGFVAEEIQAFKNELQQLDMIKVLNEDKQGDLLKLTIQSRNELSGFQMQTLIEEKGIFTEMADPINVLLVLPLLKKDQKYPFDRIVEGITSSLKTYNKHSKNTLKSNYQPRISNLVYSKKEFEQWSSRKVPLRDAVGEVAARSITPYPPGIPILLPGEMITETLVGQIEDLIKTGARFQGGAEIYQHQLIIFEK